MPLSPIPLQDQHTHTHTHTGLAELLQHSYVMVEAAKLRLIRSAELYETSRNLIQASRELLERVMERSHVALEFRENPE